MTPADNIALGLMVRDKVREAHKLAPTHAPQMDVPVALEGVGYVLARITIEVIATEQKPSDPHPKVKTGSSTGDAASTTERKQQ